VVALIAAIAASAGCDLETSANRRRIFDAAIAVHREHQRGRGSGADVAASVYGGWVDYTLGEGGARIARATMPDDAALCAVWSGVRSDTPRAIDAFEAARLGRLRAGLDEFWSAVDRGDRAAIASEIDGYGAALEEMSGGGEGARRISALVASARALGWAAKGSGAVGGDCAIAVGFGTRDPERLAARWRNEGAEPLAVSMDMRGVRREDVHA
jgi:mevalonate kinase